MRSIGRALWAVAVLPLIIPCAVFVMIYAAAFAGLWQFWDTCEFLWRNMGPDCMTIPRRELDAEQ